MKRVMLFFVFWFFACFALLSPLVFSQDSELEGLVHGNTQFAIDLYQQINSEKGNLVFSPYSISLIMALTYGGAR